MPGLHVERPGQFTTVQDRGRPGAAHWGVSASGAADALALRAGNLLLGNREGEAALEMTLTGGAFVFERQSWFALTGADFDATLDTEPVAPWRAYCTRPGARLECGAARNGARGYLCVRGGIDVPQVLGSASTHALTGIGGFRGRALERGDVLQIGSPPGGAVHEAAAEWLAELYAPGPLRVTPGPQHDWFTSGAWSTLGTTAYRVLEQSNRMGIRLEGARLERERTRELLTEGVSLGAVQVDGRGQPIVLFVEHQTTGGYPKIANVCSADLHRVGQLRPRDDVRFEVVSLAAARARWLELEARLRTLRPGGAE